MFVLYSDKALFLCKHRAYTYCPLCDIAGDKCAKKGGYMDKKPLDNETKKLTFVVIYMSMFVLVLFGLGPMI